MDEPPRPARGREQQWDRTPETERLWSQIDRMWADLKKDAADRTERLETSLGEMRRATAETIKELKDTKADKWAEKALAGAITAVVMAVLMALVALVVVGGRPGHSEGPPAAGEP